METTATADPHVLTHDGKPVAPECWGVDHLSTLLYVRAVVVDHEGKPNIDRMRTWPGRPRRGWGRGIPFPHVLVTREYPTKLANGVMLREHDDWDCVEDLVQAGLVTWEGTGMHPILGLTPYGWRVSALAQEAYAQVGGFRALAASFVVPPREPSEVPA